MTFDAVRARSAPGQVNFECKWQKSLARTCQTRDIFGLENRKHCSHIFVMTFDAVRARSAPGQVSFDCKWQKSLARTWKTKDIFGLENRK
jgi:hypothetical protein